MNGVVAVIQARMGSTRLPGKVLLPLGDRPVLEHVVRRVGRARCVDKLIVAVPEGGADRPVVELCNRIRVESVRGPERDVLARFDLARRQTGARHIVRITADCPCVDSALLDRVVESHLEADADYTSNTIDRSFPRGFDVEVARAEALACAAREASAPFEREHVMPFLYHRPDRFVLASVTAEEDAGDPAWRVCLDTEADYIMLSSLWQQSHDERGEFPGMQGILRSLADHPDIVRLNADVPQKSLQETA